MKIVQFSSDADPKDHLTEGERVNVECRVQLGDASPELLSVELVYLFDENREIRRIPMEPGKREASEVSYSCSFPVEGYGLQGMNVRVRPADGWIADLHPELIKWKD